MDGGSIGGAAKPQAPSPGLLARYGGRVPRYTSYPTAAQFEAMPDDTRHRAWLQDVDSRAPVSLYHHVPFCDRLCWYCGCHTRVVNTRAPVQSYVAALTSEIALVAGALPGVVSVSSVHFGGGTPNMLEPADLLEIFGMLRRHFRLRDDAEIAMELDPGRLTEGWVKAAGNVGLNRASLGVQDFDPAVQQAINRPQPLESVAQCVGWLRRAGVRSLNLDLMYGLPHQTVTTVRETIRQALSLDPDRIALFGYAHVPWMKPAQNLMPREALPGSAERFAQSQAAAAQLEAAGYRRIGLDHFARGDDPLAGAAEAAALHRNFQGYTTDGAVSLLGFGASAISRLPGGYVQNHPSVPSWRGAIAAGHLPAARGVAITAEDAARADAIERIMCLERLDLAELAARHPAVPGPLLDAPALQALETMEQDGLVSLTRGHYGLRAIGITELGRSFVRNVCALFDAYLQPDASKHSAGV